MGLLSLLLFLLTLSFGAELLRVIELPGAITDIAYRKGVLYVSTELGKVYLVNYRNAEVRQVTELPNIVDFMGNPIPPKIFSVDVSPSGGRILIVSQAEGGYSEVYTYEGGKLKKIVDLTKGWIIKKGKFVDERRAVLAFLGDEVALIDLLSGKILYKVQVGRSSLSDISLNDDRSTLAVSDEGGVVTLVSIKEGKVLGKFKGINVDKLYGVDFKDGKIIVGGRDRRVALYYTDGRPPKRFDSEFLVFSVALDSSARIGAFLYNEQNDVELVEVDTGRVVGFLKGHRYPVSVLRFIDDVLLVGCDDGKIFVWRY